jgi:hypothetical protein
MLVKAFGRIFKNIIGKNFKINWRMFLENVVYEESKRLFNKDL